MSTTDEFDVVVAETDDDIDTAAVREEDVDCEELEDDFDDDAPETDDDDDSVDESAAAGEFSVMDALVDDEPNAETEEDESFEEGDDDVAAYSGDDEEEETLFDDNVLELPTTVAVAAGDTCIICEVNGEPTVIGVIGKGDETADSIKDAWDKAQNAFDRATESSQAAVNALSKAEQAAKDAQTALEQAGGGASHAWTDEAGLHLTTADKSTAGPNVLVDKAGMDIYPDGNQHPLASFTKDGVYLRDYSVQSTLDGDVVTNDVIASFTKDGAVFGSADDQVGALTKEGLVVGSSDKKMATVTSDGMVVYDSQGRPAATFDDNGMQLAIGGQMVSQFGPNAIALGGAGTTSITMAGNAVLNVSKLCIGDFSNPITSRDELKGDTGPQGEQGEAGAAGPKGDTGPQGPQGAAGKDGVPGKDGVDVTSQYVYYTPSYGLAVTPSANSTSVPHAQVTSSGFFVKKNASQTLISIKDSSGGWGEQEPRMDFYNSSGSKIGALWASYGGSASTNQFAIDSSGGTCLICNGDRNVDVVNKLYATRVYAGGDFHGDSYNSVYIGTGSGGTNHGIYSINNSKWIVYQNTTGATIVQGNIRGDSDGSYSCGHSSYRWDKVYATSGTVSKSSRRAKENIQSILDDEARKLLDIDVVKFDYRKGEMREGERKGWYGVIAEDVREVMPFAVIDWDAGRDEKGNEILPSVCYEAFIPHMMRMIQLQQREIDELKQQRSRSVPRMARYRAAGMGRHLKKARS